MTMNKTDYSKRPVSRAFFCMLAAVALACVLFGCTNGSGQSSEPQAEPEQSAEPSTYTVTDCRGDETELSSDLGRIVIDQVPLASTYVMYNGGSSD